MKKKKSKKNQTNSNFKEQKLVENFWKINILLIILGIVLKIKL